MARKRKKQQNTVLWVLVLGLGAVLAGVVAGTLQMGREQTPMPSFSASGAPSSSEGSSQWEGPTGTTAPNKIQWPSDPAPTVGGATGYVAEIVNFNAETFDGNTNDDYSHPTNSYLPEGTMDYCDPEPLRANGTQYVRLRCGLRTYVSRKNIPASQAVPVTKITQGTLPDHNEMAFGSLTVEGHHTVLTLHCLWKAPFQLDLLPQSYKNPQGGGNRNYSVTSCTAEYVELRLCYTTRFIGSPTVPENNPLFRSAELIQKDDHAILRLYLKKTGAFFGWDSYYNEAGQLCLRFLNPVHADKDLAGIRILIDVGHGGRDCGAVGKDSAGKQWTEADRNLALAQELKKELEALGAEVTMNRTDTTALNVNDRNRGIHELAPDLCIAIHHNSIDGYPGVNGFECFYYHPFAQEAAQQIFAATRQAGVYKSSRLDWHYYFLSRETVCPVVLAENGYLTNQGDLTGTINAGTVSAKARALAQGTLAYFQGI